MAKKRGKTFGPATGAADALSPQGGQGKTVGNITALLNALDKKRVKSGQVTTSTPNREAGKKPRLRSDRSGERKP